MNMQISGLSASNTFSATDVLAIEVNVNGTNKTYKMTGATLATALASIGSYLTTADVVNDLTNNDSTKVASQAEAYALNEAIAQSMAIPFSYQATPGTNSFNEGGTGAVLTITAPNGTAIGYLVIRPQNYVDSSSRPVAMELYKPDWSATVWRVFRD